MKAECFTSWSRRSTVPAMPGYVEKLSGMFSVVVVSLSFRAKGLLLVICCLVLCTWQHRSVTPDGRKVLMRQC